MRGSKVLLRLLLMALAGSGAAVLSAATPVVLEELEHLSLHETARDLDLEAAWLSPRKELQISGQTAGLKFTAASREISINGMRVFLGEPILLHRGGLYISQVDFEATLKPILQPQARVPSGPVRTVVIDPGHGGRDPGTRNQELGLQEKHLSVAVSQRLQKILERHGYRVVLTRTDDTFIPLEERPARAVAAGADLFVSIHFNAVGKSTVSGVETYILTPSTHRSTGQGATGARDAEIHPGNRHDHWNALLGFLVHRQLLRDLGSFDRGLKRARFQVLRGADCPAVLVEAGYLSNSREAARIATAEFQEKLAHSLALAIDRYRRATERLAAPGQ